MNTPEAPEVKKETDENQETDWTSFGDFKKDFDVLVERIRVGPGVDIDMGSGYERKNEFLKDSPEERKYRFYQTLYWLYQNLGRLIIPGSFYDERKSVKELESDVYWEIAGLWDERQSKYPLALEFSRRRELDILQGKFSKVKNEFDSAKRGLENLAAKLRVMRGKKKERFAGSVFAPAKYKLDRLESDFSYWRDSLRRLLTDEEIELDAKERLNQLLPKFDGEEYFEVQLKVMFMIFKFVPFSSVEYRKKLKTAFDNALLRWAEKYIQDSAVIPSASPAEKKKQEPKKELSPAAEKLFTELERLLGIVEKNPVAANLVHAQIIYRTLLRLLKKE